MFIAADKSPLRNSLSSETIPFLANVTFFVVPFGIIYYIFTTLIHGDPCSNRDFYNQVTLKNIYIFPQKKHLIKSNIYSLEKAMAPHSSTLAWKTPWTEEPGRLQSMGFLGVRHD